MIGRVLECSEARKAGVLVFGMGGFRRLKRVALVSSCLQPNSGRNAARFRSLSTSAEPSLTDISSFPSGGGDTGRVSEGGGPRGARLTAPRRQCFAGWTKAEACAAASELGYPSWRGGVAWDAVHRRGDFKLEAAKSLPASMRSDLGVAFGGAGVGSVTPVEEQVSVDGTRKWLVSLVDGALVETVFIPSEPLERSADGGHAAVPQRGTLCVSSQVGCSLACTFCRTGTQPLLRNLTAAEIVGQLLVARTALGEYPLLKDGAERRPSTPHEGVRPHVGSVRNIVFMGQGEPLYNWRNVRQAISVMAEPGPSCVPRRRQTVSTAGVAPLIPKLAGEPGVGLAISLHSAIDAKRSRIMGINNTYPLSLLTSACQEYANARHGGRGRQRSRRVTFEVVLLKDVNDSMEDADALIRLARSIPCLVNIIQFNHWDGSPYQSSSAAVINDFAKALTDADIRTTVRASRGADILAACGQLRVDGLKKSS